LPEIDKDITIVAMGEKEILEEQFGRDLQLNKIPGEPTCWTMSDMSGTGIF
jgi:hypothetical protein